MEAVTLTATVQAPKPATVIFENESTCGGPLTVKVDGDGDAPHPV